MSAAKPLGVGAGLFGIIDSRGVTPEETGEQAAERHREGTKCGPDGRLFPPGAVADVHRRYIDCISAFNRYHRSTSSGAGAGTMPCAPTAS